MTVMKAFLCFMMLLTAHFYGNEALPRELNQVGIFEKIGNPVPLNTRFELSQTGQSVELSSLVRQKKPILLTLVYFDCPMLCNLVLTGLQDALKKIDLKLGDQYTIWSISMNPQDTPIAAGRFKERYMNRFAASSQKQDSWVFLTGDKPAIDRVASSVGFNYRYLPESGEYAHAAGVFILTPEGKVSRVLYGIEFKPFDLKMAILEASDKKYVSTTDKLRLFCYNYDPHQKGYVLMAQRLMKIGAFLTLVCLGGSVVWMLKKNSKIGS